MSERKQQRAIRILLCIPLAVCVLIAGASARQDSSATTKSPAAKKTTSTKAPTKSSKTQSSAKKHSSHKKSARARGQQKIDSERAQAIQEALIRQHYLSGEATGMWNQASEDAMRRYQADNGWQSKTVPDSRALIKLGLGPSKDHLLNPDSAMTTVPDPPKADPVTPTSHSAVPTATPTTPVATPAATTPASDPSNPQ